MPFARNSKRNRVEHTQPQAAGPDPMMTTPSPKRGGGQQISSLLFSTLAASSSSASPRHSGGSGGSSHLQNSSSPATTDTRNSGRVFGSGGAHVVADRFALCLELADLDPLTTTTMPSATAPATALSSGIPATVPQKLKKNITFVPIEDAVDFSSPVAMTRGAKKESGEAHSVAHENEEDACFIVNSKSKTAVRARGQAQQHQHNAVGAADAENNESSDDSSSGDDDGDDSDDNATTAASSAVLLQPFDANATLAGYLDMLDRLDEDADDPLFTVGNDVDGDASSESSLSPSSSSEESEDDEAREQRQQEEDAAHVGDDADLMTAAADNEMSDAAKNALALFSNFSKMSASSATPAVFLLTEAIVDALIASRQSLSFFITFNKKKAAVDTIFAGSFTDRDAVRKFIASFSSMHASVLAAIETCKAKRQYFDMSQLELHVVAMLSDAATMPSTSSSDSSSVPSATSAFRVFSTNSSQIFGSDERKASGEEHRPALLLPSLLRFFASVHNQKFLLDVGTFWSPFLLNVAGVGAARFENTLDMQLSIESCNGLPMTCGLAAKTVSSSNSVNASSCVGTAASDYLTDRAASFFALAGSPAASVSGEAAVVIPTAFAINRLYHEVCTALSRAPLPRFATLSASATGASHSLDSSASDRHPSSLLAFCLRESTTLHMCNIMAQNGMYVDVAKALRWLEKLVVYSKNIRAAVEAVVLAPLLSFGEQQGTDNGAKRQSERRRIAFPHDEVALLALLNSYRAQLVVGMAGSTSDTPLAPTPLTAADLAGLSAPRSVDGGDGAHSPLVCAFMLVKKVHEAGAALQKFLKPMRAEVNALLLSSQKAAPNKNEQGTAGGNKRTKKDLFRFPLLDVHPFFHSHSATGRIFCSNPNVQTVRATPFIITSGSAAGDAAVEAIVKTWRETSSAQSNAANQTSAATATAPSPLHLRRRPFSMSLRSLFVAPPGTRMVSLDYNQIELRVLAHLSKDPNLLAAFGVSPTSSSSSETEAAAVNTGGVSRQQPQQRDVIRYVAQLIFGLSSPDAVSTEQRAQAKAVVYGILYGMGDAALQARLEELLAKEKQQTPAAADKDAPAGPTASTARHHPQQPPLKANALRQLFYKAFPPATMYIADIKSEVTATRRMSSIGGRQRQLGGGGGGAPRPSTADAFSSSLMMAVGEDVAQHVLATGGAVLDKHVYSERNQAVSHRIQGSAADILKSAIIAVMRLLYSGSGGEVEKKRTKAINHQGDASAQQGQCDSLSFALLLSLHDELVFVVPDYSTDYVDRVVSRLRQAMEQQSVVFGMDVPLCVSVKKGKNFGDLH